MLFVEDEESISGPFSSALRREGFDPVVCGTLAEARAAGREFDLVLLDLMLPDGDGRDLARELRASGSEVPIIMLTARGTELERVVGLELGADDYIVKPFSPKELVARVRALFRRLERAEEGQPLTFGALVVDPARHTTHWAGEPVHLTAKEFALLVALLEAKGRVLSRQALLENVWGYSYAEGTRTVDVHVRRLREKLPAFAGSIVTVKSLGYRIPRDGT